MKNLWLVYVEKYHSLFYLFTSFIFIIVLLFLSKFDKLKLYCISSFFLVQISKSKDTDFENAEYSTK